MAATNEKNCDRKNEECIESIDDIECKSAVNNPRAHLVPRPSEDEGDPLNWPMRLTALILFQVCWLAFLGTWNTAAINSSYSLLAEDLGVSEVQASIVIALNGVGPFIWIPLANVYGRRFVYLITTFIGFATALGCGFVHSFGVLVGIRAINGIFPVSMALGPATVTDLFFYHQRGRTLGLLTVMLTSGSHFSGLFGGPVAKLLGWRWIFWITAAMNFVTLAIMVFGLPETMYYKPRLYSDTNTEPPKLSMAKYRELLRSWTSFPGIELKAKHFVIPADKYDCNKFIKYCHSSKAALCNEDKAKWEIQVENGDGVVFLDDVDVFINAGGVLNNWKWPNTEGIHNFKAPGINEPTANDPDIETDYNFTPESIAVFKNPEVLRQYRAAIIDRRIKNFQRALADSDVQKRAEELFRKSMTERLGDSEKGRKAV